MIPHQNDAVMKQHISQWQRSDLSQIAYCKEHGIKKHIFSYYKKKLSPMLASANWNPLIPVQIKPDFSEHSSASVTEPGHIQISHRNGFSMSVHRHTDLVGLKPLLELVRSLT